MNVEALSKRNSPGNLAGYVCGAYQLAIFYH